MPGNWLGGIKMINGGYVVVFEALYHYKRRLLAMKDSPEMEGVAAFAPLIVSQAAKTVPGVDTAAREVALFLELGVIPDSLDVVDRALACRAADIRRALSGNEYYAGLAAGAVDPEPAESMRAELKEYD